MTNKHITAEREKWEEQAYQTIKHIVTAEGPKDRNKHLTAFIQTGVPKMAELIRMEEILEKAILEQEAVAEQMHRAQALAASQAIMLPMAAR